MAKDVVVVAYGRSPCCRAKKGGYATTHPVEYGAQTLKGLLAKVPQVTPEMIDDVIVGCAIPINHMSKNYARLIIQRAQLPNCVTGQTINRFCSSGLQAIATAANAIWADQMDIVIAGGAEYLTGCFNIPLKPDQYNAWLEENCPGAYMPMGETAERVADLCHISRLDMDQMAVESHAKAAAAQRDGKLAKSIIPIVNAEGRTITEDEGIRPGCSLESIKDLKPCFRENGRVTAATSSQTTDAAAFVMLMSGEKAKELGIAPIAKFRGFAVAGCDAETMGLGPIYAVPKCLNRFGFTLDQMDVIEINEAFAAQALACIRELGFDPKKVNPYGGAMALGHPMGATGAFLTIKALDYLQDTGGKYAMITMCIGGGMGACGIYELC